jgi:mycothiol synthase
VNGPKQSLPEGYQARPASETDAESLYRVIYDYDVGMVGYSDFAKDDLFEFFREEHFDIDRDSWVVRDPSGRVVGFAMLWGRVPHRRYTGFAVVHPDHLGRGIGAHLLRFLDRRMSENAVDDEGAVLWNWVDREDDAARKMVEAVGFYEVRRHYTMIVDLTQSEPDVLTPEAITIRTCTEDDVDLVASLEQETFAEHWGFTPTPLDQWRKLVFERSDTDLTLWLLAVQRDEPVGYLIGREMDGLGWVGDLGVKKAHRRHGVATALLSRSFRDFRNRGYTKVGLGVDASNATGAVRLYENVGMRAERVYITYEKLYRRR